MPQAGHTAAAWHCSTGMAWPHQPQTRVPARPGPSCAPREISRAVLSSEGLIPRPPKLLKVWGKQISVGDERGGDAAGSRDTAWQLSLSWARMVQQTGMVLPAQSLICPHPSTFPGGCGSAGGTEGWHGQGLQGRPCQLHCDACRAWSGAGQG